MTVQKTHVKNIYVGNGVTKVFPITFEFNEQHPEHITVYIRNSDGLQLTNNYTLDVTNKFITYPANGEPLTAGYKLTIIRRLPYEQVLNLVNQGPYFAEDVELEFDDVVMMIQQLKEEIGRTLQVAVDVDNVDLTLPWGKNSYFKWNEDGTKIVLVPGLEAGGGNVEPITLAEIDEIMTRYKLNGDTSEEEI